MTGKLIDPKNTIALIKDRGFSFKKKFGQNFLIDERVLTKIINGAGITAADEVLEIGPGIGTLTQALCEAAGRVRAVEIDRELIPILEETLSAYDNVDIINADELERDLDRVDSWIKSGNLMADAILNSKLSLAQQKKIAVNCKARLPENLPVEDVDLCVILGNLLDNALEACEQIPQNARFLRVYLAINGRQLYLSIQNSAKEELNFNERNYITQKRGSHGFGMKRVSAVVEKYEGFLNLANEPGIFAAEVTLPLPE